MKIIVIDDYVSDKAVSLALATHLKGFGVTMDPREKVSPMKLPEPPVFKNFDFDAGKIRDKKRKFTTNRTQKKKKRKK